MPLGTKDIEEKTLREVYLPARVLNLCLPGWEQADDAELTQAVGEAMEHGYWHWRWLAAVRQHKCRLVVVQHKNAAGEEMVPHYQIGELFTLSQWHPERALVEAQALMADGAEGTGEGLTFDLPVDEELLGEWDELAEAAGLNEAEGSDADSSFELLIAAMILLDEGHDKYVGELGEGFYVATRGLARAMDRLMDDEFGRWSQETMQVYDRSETAAQNYLFPENAPGVADMERSKNGPVPVVVAPELPAEEELLDDGEQPPSGFRLN